MLVAVLVIVLAVVVGTLVYIGMQEDQGRDPLEDRLLAYGERQEQIESLEEAELSLSFKDRVIIPLAEKLANLTARFTPQQQLEEARKMLELAGQDTDPTQFFLQRIIMTIVFGGGAAFLLFVVTGTGGNTALMLTAALTGLGYYFPLLSLRSKIQKRQENVVRALPDALDLLVICVEAGLGFDAAMGKVYEKWDNELALAFGRTLREVQLGKARRDALRDMADRIDVADLNTFVAAIVQAEQLGVSMAKILRVQSDQMRVKRRQRAQEKAQQAPVKMMIPMVLLIFPSLWIVLLGPAVLQLMDTGLV
jgi:tight adherence protein C